MDRFWSKVSTGAEDECWEWHASGTPGGYGVFWLNGRLVMAHRVSVMLSGVHIPDDKEVAHLCHNPPCVNPSHLSVVTHRENMLQTTDLKGSCPKGHAHNEKNTWVRPATKTRAVRRECRTCNRDRKLRGRVAGVLST